MASVASNSSAGRVATWQEKLEELCRTNLLAPPAFALISDRRGGRTAWSCTVTVHQTSSPPATLQARFWYDGAYVNNAREDAAEVAYIRMTGDGTSNVTSPRSPSSPITPGTSIWSPGYTSTSSGSRESSNSYSNPSSSRW